MLQTVTAPVAGDSLELTIDIKVQQEAEEALKWGTDTADLKRGVVIVMNPQTGEVLAMVSLPTYDDNLFAQGISSADYPSSSTIPATAHRSCDQRAVPARLDLQARHRYRRACRRQDHQTTKIATRPYLLLGTTKFYDWNHRGFGP